MVPARGESFHGWSGNRKKSRMDGNGTHEPEENVLSNYIEGLAASGTEAEHGEVIVE